MASLSQTMTTTVTTFTALKDTKKPVKARQSRVRKPQSEVARLFAKKEKSHRLVEKASSAVRTERSKEKVLRDKLINIGWKPNEALAALFPKDISRAQKQSRAGLLIEYSTQLYRILYAEEHAEKASAQYDSATKIFEAVDAASDAIAKAVAAKASLESPLSLFCEIATATTATTVVVEGTDEDTDEDTDDDTGEIPRKIPRMNLIAE